MKLFLPKVDKVFGLELTKDVLSKTEATKMHNKRTAAHYCKKQLTHRYSAVQVESSAKADQCSKSKKRNIYKVLVKN